MEGPAPGARSQVDIPLADLADAVRQLRRASVLVVGDEETIKVHIHTPDPGRPIDL
jgi:dihydroxyacetone kinase-like predicted kinase